MRFVSRSPEETVAAGAAFAATLRPGATVALLGTLGSGKTCFTSGICAHLGVPVVVTSPTFTIVNEYPAPFGRVVHVDLYRIRRREELAELGFDEYFTPSTVAIVEWGEDYLDLLPADTIRVRLAHGEHASERRIVVEENGR
jgi:tRNA threonylcarbamoyladenosine biosynthesis protein TsaE